MKLSDVFEIAGFICLILFALVLFPPAALAVAGCVLLFLGYAHSNPETDVNLIGVAAKAITKYKLRRAAKRQEKADKE